MDDLRGYSRALSAGEVASLVTALAAPTGLVATPGDARVILTWNLSTNANGYNIRRAITSGGPYSPVPANVVGASFTDTNVLTGQFNYYVVTATNTVAASTYSNEAGTRPVATNAPSLAMVLAGGKLQLTWPVTHTGWRLEVQTNMLATGLGTN